MIRFEKKERLREASDEALMARYVDGDVAAFELLFLRYERRAYRYFLRRTRSNERAQDLYQELFLRIHRARDQYDPKRPFASWFFHVANNLLIDDWRRPFRHNEVSIGDRQTAAPEADAEQQAILRQQLDRIVEVLTPDELYVLVSAKFEGISYTELSDHLGRSADAIKKMASRATGRLRSVRLGDVTP